MDGEKVGTSAGRMRWACRTARPEPSAVSCVNGAESLIFTTEALRHKGYRRDENQVAKRKGVFLPFLARESLPVVLVGVYSADNTNRVLGKHGS